MRCCGFLPSSPRSFFSRPPHALMRRFIYHGSMTLESGRDLGHGVRVVPGDGGEVIVVSETVDLGWRPRADGRPGSAVTVDGEGFEVVARQSWGRSARWILRQWSSEDVMRVVSPLDESAVAAAAADALAQARTKQLRPAFWMLAPILGFAVASWQRKWRDEWGYPASTATWMSAIVEMLLGAACMVELIASAGAGVSIFPWIPRPVVFFGLYLFGEGFVRLAMVSSDSEPVGSFIGAAVSVVERRREPARPPLPGPKIERFDEDAGALELRSPVVRRDWEEPGLLPFRGAAFVLDGTRRLGEAWIYTFRRVELKDDEEQPRLRLPPPPPRTAAPVQREGRGVMVTVFLSIVCTIAPARFQERWAWYAGVRVLGFTIFGAVVELLGGLIGLGSEGSQGVAGVLVNFFFVGEAVVRLRWVVVERQPMGSVLGLVLAPLLEKLLPE